VLDSALLAVAEQVPLEAERWTHEPPPSLPPIARDEAMHVLVRSAEGQVLHQTGPSRDLPWPVSTVPGVQTVDGWRIATRRTLDGRVMVQVGEPLIERRQAITESTAALLLPMLGLLPLAALLIDLLLRRSFRSVHEVSEQWRARPAGDISPLNASDLPNEFDPMVASINALVERLQGVVVAERAFAASSAHELRTPLAAARAQAQRLVAELPEGDAQERALALVRSLDRLTNTSTKLLQLSRVESGIGLAREPVDLCQLTTLVADEFRHAADVSHRLQLELPPQPVIVMGDIDALGIAIRNLIENALKHAPHAQVRVQVERPGSVVVSDDGPGVDPQALATLSQPYSRAKARVEGTGLGLAIVARIAEQQRAALSLASPVPGENRGFRASLSISPEAS
jgi:two-component system OmpR family sensor kinase